MKKSSLFLIIVLYLVSIVAITFFGQAITMDQFKVYMDAIWITNDYETVVFPNGEELRYIWIPFNETGEGYTTYQIYYKYSPEDASEPGSVKFYLTGDTYTDPETEEVTVYAQINAYGEILFWRPATITVYVTTADGSQLSDWVSITCYDPETWDY
ncbi:MAG: hypothetical protein LUC16_01790 [Coprobacillus sp.]|nr:hypothetical protein [Coprobacillus sp.]